MNLLNKNLKIIIPFVVLAVIFVFSEFYASGKNEKDFYNLKPVEVIPHETNALNKLLNKKLDQPKLIQKKSIEWQGEGIYPSDPQALKKQKYKKPINTYPVQTLSKQTPTLSKPIKVDTSNLNVNAKTLLRITGAKSVDELNNPNEEVHGIRIYYKHYKRCVIEQAKASYVYNKRDEFTTNHKLTKTEWNEFIKEQLNEKLNTLTKDNLLERSKECKLEIEKIITQLYKFDKDWELWIRPKRN